MAQIRTGSKFVGVEPFSPFRIALKDGAAGWEEMVITKDPNTPWHRIKATEAGRFVCLNQSTHQLESRGNTDGWGGEWFVAKDGGGYWQAACDTVTLQLENYVAAIPVGTLSISGNDFIRDGKRVSLVGIDGFLDYRFWLDGGEDKLNPFMKESVNLGFQVRRVFLAGSAKQNQVLDLFPLKEPRFYDQLRPFVAYLNAHGIIPLLTICVDMQDVMPNVTDRLHHWNSIIGALQGSGLLFLISYGNEADKNGFNPYEVSSPGNGIWWSRGSKTQDDFYAPNGATAAEFHPVRNIEGGRTQMDAVASVYFMQSHGCEMLWLDESYPFDNNTATHYAYDLARLYSTYWALAVYHNRQSQRGLPMGPGTLNGAQAWVKGMGL